MILKSDELVKGREMILNDNIWKVIFYISIPIALANFLQVLYNTVDTYFAATIGIDELAGVSFVIYINNFLRSASNGISVAGTTIIAKKIGENEFEEAKKLIVQLLLLLIFLSFIIMVTILPFSKNVLYLMGVTENILEFADKYLKLNIISLVLLLITNAFISVKRAMGSAKVLLTLNIFSLLIKSISCYIFISIYNLGIEGIVYSTMIARGMICIFAFYDFFIKDSIIKIKFSNFKVARNLMIAIIIIGIPLAIERSTLSFGHILLNRISITFGSDFVAARGIVNRMISLGFSILTGFGTGIIPLLSQNIGANNYKRVKEIMLKSLTLVVGLSFGIYVFLYLSKYKIVDIFIVGESGQFVNFIIEGFSIFSIAMLGWGAYQVAFSFFKGFGHTKFNLTISLIRLYLFRLPLIYLFINYGNMAQRGIWWGMLLSNILGAITVWGIIYFNYYRKNQIKKFFSHESGRKGDNIID